MRCQHCGNHEVNYHLQTNINGAVTEAHFCAACAQEAGSKLMQPMEALGMAFFKTPLFGHSFFSPTCDALDQMSQGPFFIPTAPASGLLAQTVPAAPLEPKEGVIPAKADEALRHRRELNQLRGEMETAVKVEHFERAAELRDEIHRRENA